jgi:hypothetical protein
MKLAGPEKAYKAERKQQKSRQDSREERESRQRAESRQTEKEQPRVTMAKTPLLFPVAYWDGISPQHSITCLLRARDGRLVTVIRTLPFFSPTLNL